MTDDTSEWFYLALEFRAGGYSMGEMIVALTPDAMSAIRAAYRTNIGRDE